MIPLQAFRRERHGAIFELRDVLLEHLDGRLIPMTSHPRQSRRNRAFRNLVACGLLKYWPEGQPEYSIITDRGREELAHMLADYAEVLTRVALMQNDELADRSGLGQFPQGGTKAFNRGSVLIPLGDRAEAVMPEVALRLEQVPADVVDQPVFRGYGHKSAAVTQHHQKA